MTGEARDFAESDAITTHCDEWAIQCHTRDGDLYTGRAHTRKSEAMASGQRLERINGAEWWIVTRRRIVTVETSPWTRDTPPGEGVGE